MLFEDRMVCVTGASAGIGAACAEAFAAEGARLTLCARRFGRLEEFACTLPSRFGVPVHSFALDVTDRDAVARAFESLPPGGAMVWAMTAEDVARAVLFCASRPPHVNIHQVVLTPADQATSTMVHRGGVRP